MGTFAKHHITSNFFETRWEKVGKKSEKILGKKMDLFQNMFKILDKYWNNKSEKFKRKSENKSEENFGTCVNEN